MHVFSDRNIYIPDFAVNMQARSNNYDQRLYATAMVQVSESSTSILGSRPNRTRNFI